MRTRLATLLLAATVLAGCSGDEDGFVVLDDLTVSVDGFDASEGTEAVPARHTCDGDDVTPTLRWSGVPEGADEIVVLVTDVDADGFVHWAVAGIDAAQSSLSDGQGVEGTNGFGRIGYAGPCPPEGDQPHRYVFNVYALSSRTGLDPGFPGQELPDKLGDAIAAGSVTGTYARP